MFRSERRREVVHRLPRGVDRPLQVEVRLVREHALARAVDRDDCERRVTGEGSSSTVKASRTFPETPRRMLAYASTRVATPRIHRER
jgi:hypothetical protein